MRFVFLFVLALNLAFAQNDNAESPVTLGQVQQLIDKSLLSKWYEKIQLKGYADFRYNRLMETNSLAILGCLANRYLRWASLLKGITDTYL